MTAATERSRQRWGRWPVRLLAVAGSFLIALASFGWWLDTRVISDEGFADVVAKSSQRQPVRDYIADQATLRLARSSNFVSAARPIVTEAVSTAIATPPVEDAVRDFALRAHVQVFKVREQRRVDIDAQQASTSIRSALQTINPSLAKKLPANVLDASATISQNSLVDSVLQISGWIWLWFPIGLLGVVLLILAMVRARDRVHAIRVVGMIMAVAGALLVGFGAASPIVAAVAAGNEPLRGEAVAAFVETLTGRLTGSGWALILVGIAVALAPGRDGGDLGGRVARYRTYWERRWASPRWRFGIGVALFLFAAWVLGAPDSVASTFVPILGVIGLYVAVIVCLRASGLLVTDHAIARLHKRQVFGVFAVMVVALLTTSGVAIALVAASTSDPTANPRQSGCNGYIELCPQPIDQVVWPASHNAMSSSAYNFLGAEHTITIPDQLNAGVRFLMLDAYYGYDDDGIVRTNLAGGVDRKQLEKERGKDAVRALDRMGALTGTADTSGEKQEIYFCHDFCELGAVKASEVFAGIKDFLDRNLTEVVILDFEDYVQPKDMYQALDDAGLTERLRRLNRAKLHDTAMLDLVEPANDDETENPRRLIVAAEKHGGQEKWLPKAYSFFQETPFTFTAIKDFNCKPKRGGPDNPLMLINHWLRPDGPPDPGAAGKVNARKVLTERVQQCLRRRNLLPNVVAVDFTEIGDLRPVVNDFNAAVARVTGVTSSIDRAIDRARNLDDLTEAQLAEIRGLRRLPKMSEDEARELLGTFVDRLETPPALAEFERQNQIEVTIPSTTTTTPTPIP